MSEPHVRHLPDYSRVRAVKIPGTHIQLLTETSKMGCFSWSLTPVKSCPGRDHNPDSPCGICYPQKGRYLYPCVRAAMDARFDWTVASMRTQDGFDSWVTTMVAAIKVATAHNRYFRVHDSGDVFSPRYAAAWIAVCKELPEVRFWFPTRSYGLPHILAMLQMLAALPNVTVRPSARHLDAAAPVVPGLHAGSGVGTADFTCPASRQGNQCLTCRHCWDAKDAPVSYHAH